MWFEVHLSLEQECRYPTPLECILDNLVVITCFHWSLLEGDTLDPELRWCNLATASNSLNHIVNPSAPLAHKKAPDHVALSHWFRLTNQYLDKLILVYFWTHSTSLPNHGYAELQRHSLQF
jgi:hypothetical protein